MGTLAFNADNQSATYAGLFSSKLPAHMIARKHRQRDSLTHGYSFIIFPSAVNSVLLSKQKAMRWETCAVYICPHA